VRVGAYPGTFNPPTVAHLAIAEAALEQGGLDAVHLVLSHAPLGKSPTVPSFADRLGVLEAVAASRAWLEVRVTESRLIAEVVTGYDAVIMGMDKWLQVLDPAWYGGSEAARDAAVAALPDVLVAARDGSDQAAQGSPLTHPSEVVTLVVDQIHLSVSSSQVRAGRVEWMLPEAAEFDARTGAWSHPERYRPGIEGAPTGEGRPASLPPMHDPGSPHG
jgi:Cytidylyltransferase-like